MGRAIVVRPSGISGRRKAFPDLIDQSPTEGKVDTQEEKPDTYKERLFKYIPAEVVTLYLGLTAIVASARDAPHFLDWTIFVAGLVGTPYYLWRWQKVTAPMQLTISALAFAVWVFALGGPFKDIHGYKPVYGAVLLPLYTFFVAGISPGQAKPGPPKESAPK
jgi:hypothetical protein